MNEKSTFESVIRTALEENEGLNPGCLHALETAAAEAARKRRARVAFFRWGAPFLAAAAITVALVFRATFMTGKPTGSGRPGVGDAIGLLCELDGIEAGTLESGSTEDLLIAWLDAPCANLL